MKRNERVEAIMCPKVTTVDVTQELGEVRRLMASEQIHRVPVLQGRTLVGIISTLDLVGLSGPDAEHSIESVMQTDLLTLDLEDTVLDAARHLRSGQLHSLPVVNAQGELVGIVTGTDVIRYLYDQY